MLQQKLHFDVSFFVVCSITKVNCEGEIIYKCTAMALRPSEIQCDNVAEGKKIKLDK